MKKVIAVLIIVGGLTAVCSYGCSSLVSGATQAINKRGE